QRVTRTCPLEAHTSPMELLDALSTTRTVRRRLDLDRPVEIAAVERALVTAARAPTGGARQRSHFVVVTDPGRRRVLGERYRQLWWGAHGQLFRSPEAAGAVPADLVSAAHLADHFSEVPVHVVACVEDSGGDSGRAAASLWGSVLPAAWSYMLALRSEGLVAAWTTTLIDDDRFLRSELGLPEEVRVAAVLP